MRMSAFGLQVELPAAWDGRLYRRTAEAGEQTYPVLHAASFPLPAERGDYGSGAVDAMGRDDVFVALREFDRGSARTSLFAQRGVPTLHPGDFAPQALQRAIPGQSGCQRFFTANERPFCLYVVLGSHARRVPLTRKANDLVHQLAIA
jgi:hypothetical protein